MLAGEATASPKHTEGIVESIRQLRVAREGAVKANTATVREVFRRYTAQHESIGEIARALSCQGILTRTGKTVWDRSTVWGMLRNPAYRGQAAFGKTKISERYGKPTRTTRARGERRGRRQTRHDQPSEQWTLIPVPALVTDEQFELAQARLTDNARFAKRNTREPGLLQGLVVCRECGYSCYRTSTRTSNKRISYYRCIGQDGWRHVGGKRCTSGPVRADELDPLVWAEVSRLLEHPELVQAEIDRRLAALRTEHPAARRRETLERDTARADGAIARLIEAYQEQLISLAKTCTRMPELRKRQTALRAQHDTLVTELNDAETYLALADTLESFLTRLTDGLDQLTIEERQRLLRLVVRDVLIGGEDDNITIRHSIPAPTGSHDADCPLRGSSHLAAALQCLPAPARPGLADTRLRRARPLRRRSGRDVQDGVGGPACPRGAPGGTLRARAEPKGQDADRAPGGGRRGDLTSSASTTATSVAAPAAPATSPSSPAGPHVRRCSTPVTASVNSRRASGCCSPSKTSCRT